MRHNDIYTQIKNGMPSQDFLKRISVALIQHEGKWIRCRIERKKNKRSTPQLRYYYGYCLPNLLAHFIDCGYEYTKDELDAFIRVHVMKVRKEVLGVMVPGHTEDLSAAEFETRLLWLRKWAAEAGCDLLEPNEQFKPPLEAYEKAQ